MKKIKIKKCMTSFLMLAVMVVSIIGLLPKINIYASSFFSVTVTERNGSSATTSYQAVGDSDVKMYVFYIPPSGSSSYYCVKYFFISDESIDLKTTVVSNPIDSESTTASGSLSLNNSVSVDDKTYYYGIGGGTSFTDQFTPKPNFSFNGSKKLYSTSNWDYKDDEIAKFFITGKLPVDVTVGEVTSTDDYDNQPDGSSTNPIRDKSVGYPDIYDYQFLIVKPKPLTGYFDNTDGDYDKLKNADYFKWKSKSTTGFSLTSPSDEYKDVYIQTKIVSKFKYNDKMNGKGEWHNYDNYGEVGYLPFVSASEKKLSVSFQQLTETLPKTFMETHNFKYQYQDYDYYFRIVYTRADDLKVIPTYYSGGWRRVSLHSNNGKHDENGEGDNSSAVIEDGDDDGGEWKKDEDSKDNDKNIDNGTTDGSDLDDAADNADNKNNSSSSGLNINNIRGFMNQIGDVPKAIGKLFTFLPDWVLVYIGFGFVVLVALMIIKAIRG